MSLLLAHVGGGTLEPLQLVGPALAAVAYARRATTLAARGRPVPLWRQLCFAGGIGLIALTLASPLAHIGEELVLGHMAQHLLMADIAALLIVLGLTGPILQPLLAIRAIDRLRTLTWPPLAFGLWAASLFLWHLPGPYQAALTSEPIHALQHACFVGFGVLMWMPLVGPLPVPSWFRSAGKLAYTGAVRLAGAALGNVFMWANTVFYPDYAPGQASFGIDPIADQGIAGVIMTAEGGLITLGVLSWLMLRWAHEDTERQRLVDLADARGVELSSERAGRAVAAGQGQRLEERLLAPGGPPAE